MFGTGTPMARILPSEGWRRLITGFFFGSTGALIAISPVGRVSGAHINPAVTLAFRWMGKLDTRTSLVYIAGQCIGGILGCVPLLAWGNMGRSVAYGATTPGAGYSILAALTGAFLATFLMVALRAVFLCFRRILPFAPGIFPPLFAILVLAEAPISGTSANPARSLGPSVISGQWQCGWIYWVGPILGALVACLLCSALARRITVAKLSYFDGDRDGLSGRSL